jgi:hypothetical protein
MINKIPYLLLFLCGLIAGVSLHSFYEFNKPKPLLPTKCTITQGKHTHQFECSIEMDHGNIKL